MELKPGYKQTEVGVIPFEWEVTKLASVCREPMQNGVFYKPSRKGVGVKLINVGDLYRRTPIDTDSLELFDANENERERFRVEDGDLFFTRSSVVPSGIAHCNIYRCLRPESVVFDSHVIRVRPDTEKISPSYFFRYCVSSVARRYLVSHAKTTTMTTIDQGVLGNCPVLLPTKAEQEAIAAALSDVDALIESLEQLIAKKRAIKQGMMQELLTGRSRLSGFDGEWKIRTLFEIAGYRKELFDDGDWIEAKFLANYGVRLVQTGNIGEGEFVERGERKFVSEETFHQLRCKEIREGDVLICRLAEPAGRACILPKLDTFKAITAVDVTIFRPLGDIADSRFLVQLFSTQNWFDLVSEWCGGTTRTRISRNALGRIEILLPEVKEQTAITIVLSDMDAEIAALEQRRDKTKLLKQGMMQDLLTGKTRLV